MQVGFLSVKLKKLCEDKAARQREWQKAAADQLATRLDDLAAAANLDVLRSLPGKWEELTGDRKGQLSCRLDKKLRLVVRPTRQPPPSKPDGGLDWRAVDAVTILEVEKDYSAAQLQSALPAMRALSLEAPDRIRPGLVKLCAEAGVALVFVPALPGTHVSGVACWLNSKPLIQLSLLGQWNHGFSFSFFHEVAHVLKHPTRAIFLDDAAAGDTVDSAEEQEANRFATDTLLPRALQAQLATLPLTAASIQAFAAEAGIHPGIVVGQLQHRGRLGIATPLAKLKDRYVIAPDLMRT